MSNSHSRAVSAVETKQRSSSTGLALFLGLALLLPSTVVLATNKPIPGIDIIVEKNPSGVQVSVPTGANAAISTTRSNIKKPSITTRIDANRAMGEVSTTRGLKIAENNSPLPTSRGIHVAAGDINGDGVVPGRANAAINANSAIGEGTIISPTNGIGGLGGGRFRGSAPPPPKDGDGTPLGLSGDPIPGRDIVLEEDPAGIKVSAKTDSTGAFHFDKLPTGNYTLKLNGQPDQSLTVGIDGIAGGKVMRSPDGTVSIFDRWGSRFTNDISVRKAGETPMEFGSGSTMGSGPSMGPSAGPDMGGPMGPSSGRP